MEKWFAVGLILAGVIAMGHGLTRSGGGSDALGAALLEFACGLGAVIGGIVWLVVLMH